MELFILETKRLRLCPLNLEDAEHLHQLFDTDPEVWKFDPGYASQFVLSTPLCGQRTQSGRGQTEFKAEI